MRFRRVTRVKKERRHIRTSAHVFVAFNFRSERHIACLNVLRVDGVWYQFGLYLAGGGGGHLLSHLTYDS
jgi:hypothetical protein